MHDEAKAVVDQIRAAGGQADAVAADLAMPDGAHVLAAQVRNLVGNRLDIFVSNAGISNAAPIESITVKDFDDLFAVNVRAPYFLLQQLLPILGEGGSVVFLSSLGARAAVGTLSAYASTKGAINTLVKYFAAALGPRGIRVNVVSAGVVDTDALQYFPNREELLANYAQRAPAGPVLTPQDVAGAVYLLCLPEAGMINGHTLVVDGGFAISG